MIDMFRNVVFGDKEIVSNLDTSLETQHIICVYKKPQ